jgi:hypothetical protein
MSYQVPTRLSGFTVGRKEQGRLANCQDCRSNIVHGEIYGKYQYLYTPFGTRNPEGFHFAYLHFACLLCRPLGETVDPNGHNVEGFMDLDPEIQAMVVRASGKNKQDRQDKLANHVAFLASKKAAAKAAVTAKKNAANQAARGQRPAQTTPLRPLSTNTTPQPLFTRYIQCNTMIFLLVAKVYLYVEYGRTGIEMYDTWALDGVNTAPLSIYFCSHVT